jgi:hypothetical protein
MGRVIVGLAVAGGLMLAVSLSPAQAACTGSEITTTARGGMSVVLVNWRLNPPCDVAETGLLMGHHLRDLTKVVATIRRDAGGYSSTLRVEEAGVYWIAAYVVDVEGNMITSEPEFADVFGLDDVPSARALR